RTGATTCVSGAVCTVLNPYYSQCIPASSSTFSTSSQTSSATTISTSTTSSTQSTTTSSSPTSSGTPANLSPEWAAAYTKARAAVAQLSLTDKVNLATGVQWQKGNCVGNTPPIESINFPGLCLEDGPVGARYADNVSAFTAGINVAATFNRTLMAQHGAAVGAEFRGKGINVALAPMMNIVRAPAAGRNWESFGGDPYLSGEAAFEVITGIQSQGVQASAKHYVNNEQEHFRDSSSSNVDDRTQHEIYAAPVCMFLIFNVNLLQLSSFDTISSPALNDQSALKIKVSQKHFYFPFVIEAASLVNGSYACENDKTLNGILKDEFGFPGYVVSDWWATHSTLSVNNGLDASVLILVLIYMVADTIRQMTMPGDISLSSALIKPQGTTYFGQALVNAVQSGSVSQSRIDDMALRILAAWYLVGQDSSFPSVNFNAWNINAPVNTHVDVQGDHKAIIRNIGVASTVLLKNAKNVLPLVSPKSIGIVGNGAGSSSRGPNGYTDRSGNDGWGSGTADFPYLITPLDAITAKAKVTGTTISSSLSDTDLNAAANAVLEKDVAIVFITADSGEGYLTVEGNAGDRNDLGAWHGGDALVAKVASVNSNTIVVVNSVGPIIMEAWIDHVNVTAVVWSGLPGQEAGNSVTDILYGLYNPSGRLPYTIGKSTSDYAAQVLYSSSASILSIPYSEGLFVDYRHFDKNAITPRFEFGFGLSYTTFQYSSMSISGSTVGGSAPTGSALDPWLHTKVITITFTVQNNGTVAGHEIPQLYTTPPAVIQSAPKNLKGFDSIYLAPGQSKTATMQLSRYDISFWDVLSQRWKVPTGTHGISIGASSRDIRLTGSFMV
ncbi:putative beta-glucosidase L, partial [Termitomyces sp. J132]